METINDFVNQLAQTPVPAACINPYGFDDPDNELRRQNLQLYLTLMSERQPLWLLLGEAPGYRGCRLTGIPFTSPYLLHFGIQAFNIFGQPQGFRLSGAGATSQKEATATILWQTLIELKLLPLLWNIFPFHPHEASKPKSNRPPTKSEWRLGERFVRGLIRLFTVTQIIAVGKKAETALNSWEMPNRSLRHPSYGGKTLFETQLHSYFTEWIENA